MIKRTLRILQWIAIISAVPLVNGYARHDLAIHPDSGAFPEIVLYAASIDTDTLAVSTLSKAELSLTEIHTTDPQSVSPDYFRIEEIEDVGVSFALLTDIDADIFRETRIVSTALRRFLENSGEFDQGTRVFFAGEEAANRSLSFISEDSNADGISDFIESIDTVGIAGHDPGDDPKIDFWDRIAEGIRRLQWTSGPKIVIALSYVHADNDPVSAPVSLTDAAVNAGTMLYLISLGQDSNALKSAVDMTGGRYFHVPSAADLDAVLRAIHLRIHCNYRIAWTSPFSSPDKTVRTVRISAGGEAESIRYMADTPPRIVLNDRFRSQIRMPDEPVRINGYIADPDARSLNQLLTVTLFYRHRGEYAATSVPLGLINPGREQNRFAFDINIPEQAVNYPGVSFYIQATDGIHAVASPVDFDIRPHCLTVMPNRAPEIIHSQPSTAIHSHQPLNLSVRAADPDTDGEIDRVRLHYRIQDSLRPAAPFISIPMQPDSSTEYTAIIPARHMTPKGVDYYISAWDDRGIRTDSGSAEAPYIAFDPESRPAQLMIPDTIETQYPIRGPIIVHVDKGAWLTSGRRPEIPTDESEIVFPVGLLEFTIHTPETDTVTATIALPETAFIPGGSGSYIAPDKTVEPGTAWAIYTDTWTHLPSIPWELDREQHAIVLTWVDGGPGDRDNTINGIIQVSGAPGHGFDTAPTDTEPADDSANDDSNHCFISLCLRR